MVKTHNTLLEMPMKKIEQMGRSIVPSPAWGQDHLPANLSRWAIAHPLKPLRSRADLTRAVLTHVLLPMSVGCQPSATSVSSFRRWAISPRLLYSLVSPDILLQPLCPRELPTLCTLASIIALNTVSSRNLKGFTHLQDSNLDILHCSSPIQPSLCISLALPTLCEAWVQH